MLIPINWLVPNPFRDFGRYPMRQEQIQVLRESIDGLSFWGGVTARPDPSGNAERFEIAGGHHRIEAYRQAREADPTLPAQIEICVAPYTDLQMAQVQAIENMSQGGNAAAAALDAIGGLYEVLAYSILSGGDLWEISQTWKPNPKALETFQGQLASGQGLGRPIFLEVLPSNCMPAETIKIALRTLKDSGLDIPIMQRVHARIALETAEREAEEQRKVAEAEAERERAEAEALAAEEARKAAEARTKAAAEARAIKEAERHKAELARQAALSEESERKAAEAEERERAKVIRQREAEQRKAEKAELKRLREEEKAREQAECSAKATAKKQQEIAAREAQARENAERAKLAAEERPQTLDPRVSSQLGWSNYQVREWNRAVSSPAARKYLPVDQHFPLACAIKAEGEALKAENENFRPTAEWVAMRVETEITRILGIQQGITKQEKAAALRDSLQKRVLAEYKRIENAFNDLRLAERRLEELRKEYDETDFGDFTKGETGTYPYISAMFDVLKRDPDIIHRIISKERKL